MSPYHVVSVGVRLFAIWLAIYAARSAPAFFVQVKRYDDNVATMVGIGFLLAICLVIVALLVFPHFFAKGLLAGQTQLPTTPSTPDRWFDVGCSLIGLWVLTDAIPGLIRYAVISYLDTRDPATLPLPPSWHANAIYDAIELVLGLWLFLGGSGLKRLAFWARYAGPS